MITATKNLQDQRGIEIPPMTNEELLELQELRLRVNSLEYDNNRLKAVSEQQVYISLESCVISTAKEVYSSELAYNQACFQSQYVACAIFYLYTVRSMSDG